MLNHPWRAASGYYSIKVNSSDLIAVLDKNIIDWSQTLYGGEVHVFYLIKIKVILKVIIVKIKKRPEIVLHEFEREIKNEVISSKVEHLPINTMDNVSDIKGYSDVMKLFRVNDLVVRFVENIFRKIKGDNLNLNSYVDAKEIKFIG